jgi:hypothetical protein
MRARRCPLSVILTLLAASFWLWPRVAQAEIEIAEQKGWTLSMDGRFNAFLSYGFGDGYPSPADPAGSIAQGSGLRGEPGLEDGSNKIQSFRVRSGFLGNILGFGIKKHLNDDTTLRGYMAIWSTIETNHTRYVPISADVREGYMKIEGPWGSVLAGRALGLFSRGSVEIDFSYAHGYGLGYPCNVDKWGPTCGHIGFGVLFPFFASGVVYATPSLAGLTLTTGVYDPVVMAGKWDRTGLPRVEGELAFDTALGTMGKAHVFATGVWQKLGRLNSDQSTEATGGAGGARFELGPVRIGGAAHYGKGLGFFYALENSPASFYTALGSEPPEVDGTLRTFDGFYAQGAVVLGRVDLAVGYGLARVRMLDLDRNRQDCSDPNRSCYSLPKQQAGISAGAFYHIDENLVFGLDFFRADFAWYQGEKQGVNFVNAGLTMPW